MTYDSLPKGYWEDQIARVGALVDKINGNEAAALGRVVPGDDDMAIGEGRRLQLAVMFLDISGFSRRRSVTPGEQDMMLRMLNLFFTEMIKIAEDYGGTVEKNTGDGLMAYFENDGQEMASKRALTSAMTMMSANEKLIRPILLKSGLEPVEFRVSIDYGPVTVATTLLRRPDGTNGRPGILALAAWSLLVGVAGACSKGGTDYGKLACLDGWPTLPTASGPAASLGATPAVLWQTPVGSNLPTNPGVALSGDQVIASVGPGWVSLDRTTGQKIGGQVTTPDPANYSLGPPVVDSLGQIYVQSRVVLYAFGLDGTKRWTFALPGRSLSSEPIMGSFTPTLVGDSQLLSFAGAQETAFDVSGNQLWTTTGLGAVRAVGHWGLGYDGSASYALDLRTGAPGGRFRAANGHDVIVLVPLNGRGVLAVDRDNNDGLHFVLLDPCGSQVWSVDVPGGKTCINPAVVIGTGEVAYVQIDACGSAQPNPRIVAIDPSGHLAAGPSPRVEMPWVAGSDGTIYAAGLSGTSQLVALSPDLAELWRITVPGGLTIAATGVLADDGVLYTQTSSGVTAIQTTSPGLAASSWPTYRHDNRSTNWAGGQL